MQRLLEKFVQKCPFAVMTRILRDSPGAPLPGKVVARFDLQRQLFDRVYLLTDAHDQELVTCDRLVDDLTPKDVLIADRRYCIVAFLKKIAAAAGFFVIRQHARLKGKLLGKRKRIGELKRESFMNSDEEIVNEVSHFYNSMNVSRYSDGMFVVLDDEFWRQYVPKKKNPKRSKNTQSKHASTAKLIKLAPREDP